MKEGRRVLLFWIPPVGETRDAGMMGRSILIAALLATAAALQWFAGQPFILDRYPDPYPAARFGIGDERRHYFRHYGLLSPHRDWPRPARQPAEPPQRAQQICGYVGGQSLMHPGVHWIDACALTDPFLARLPAHFRRRPGHHHRWLPTDYILYAVGKADTIGDENLRGLLQDVTLAARSPALFSRDRLAAIWRLNSGHYRGLDLSAYRDRWLRPGPAVSARAQSAVYAMRLSELDAAPRADGDRWLLRLARREMSPASWDHPYLPPRLYNRVHIRVDPPRLAAALQLSLSDMEGYEIRINGEPVAEIPRVGGDYLLKNHTVTLPRPMRVETISIQTQGRHKNRAFSIGHLRLE